jgi:outer membrane murein-binding lipoprotein Lpp
MTLRDTIINAVAGTLVLAAGGTIVGLKVNDAKQDERIERIEQLNASVDGLRVDLQRVDGKLERLDGRLEGEREPRQ